MCKYGVVCHLSIHVNIIARIHYKAVYYVDIYFTVQCPGGFIRTETAVKGASIRGNIDVSYESCSDECLKWKNKAFDFKEKLKLGTKDILLKYENFNTTCKGFAYSEAKLTGERSAAGIFGKSKLPCRLLIAFTNFKEDTFVKLPYHIHCIKGML